MSGAIKRFFERKRREARFKAAGPGHKLGDADEQQRQREHQQQVQRDQQQVRQHQAGQQSERSPHAVSEAKQQAAQAALSRLQPASTSDDFVRRRSQAVIRAQVQRELEQKRRGEEEAAKLKNVYGKVEEKDKSDVIPNALATSGVYYHCPLIGSEERLSKKEMKERIKAFLNDQMSESEDKGLTATLIIRTMANNEEKAELCVSTLDKYLSNIIEHPEDAKFRRIRKNNKIYAKNVADVEGSKEFLEACGFKSQVIDDEDFWIHDPDTSLETIRDLKEALLSAEAIKPELDRDVKVLLPKRANQKFELPDDFFNMTAEEIRKEMQNKAELLEREGMLRTKAMREREEQQYKRRFRYTLIRVRFPDQIVLQATFAINERFRLVHDLIAENLRLPLPFVLYMGQKRLESSEYDQTLMQLDLVPSALLTFAWHPEIAEEIEGQRDAMQTFLNDDAMALAEE